MGRKPIVNIEIIQELNKLYSEGYNMKEIGEKLSIGHSTVCNYIWKPRPHGTVDYKRM